jgi:hypothetical protein
MSAGLTTLGRRRHRTGLLGAAVVVALTGFLGLSATADAADAAYASQPLHETALYKINGPNNAGAQEVVPRGDHVDVASAWVESQSGTGTITASLRTTVTDPASQVASASVDIALLGGTGSGWVDFRLDADVSAGARYFLVLQASTTQTGRVAWFGTRTAVAGGLPSWNYDLAYWGGWKQYSGYYPAFVLDPVGSQGCGDPDACYKATPSWVGAANSAGLYSNGTATAGISPTEGWGGSYVEGSNVLRLPSGRWRYLPDGATTPVTVAAGDPQAARQVEAARAWLAQGTVPGGTAEQREVASRALLSMRALLQPNGAVAAGWYGAWKYSWPRDTAFIAAAFVATGHVDEAHRILQYNARTQRADGTWEARTTLDGAGPPDGRHWQLDANGWVPWATWQWFQAAAGQDRRAQLAELYPMVAKAADYTVGSLDARGLPPASPDYWEIGTTTTNIGTAAPLLAGLDAAAELARTSGHPADAKRWEAGARTLSRGIAEHFAPNGYPRTVDNLHGRDSAVAFMAPPFNAAPEDLPGALSDTWDALVRPNGGVVPGNDPAHDWGQNTWTPETSFFALAWAGTGQPSRSQDALAWVTSHRNWLGELPEKVTADGHPGSTVPLAWTDALVLMTMSALDGNPLPTPRLHPGP